MADCLRFKVGDKVRLVRHTKVPQGDGDFAFGIDGSHFDGRIGTIRKFSVGQSDYYLGDLGWWVFDDMLDPVDPPALGSVEAYIQRELKQ